VEARPAGNLEGAGNAVAHRGPGHRIAGFDHRPDVLVADRETRLDVEAAIVDMEVGPADPGGLYPQDGVTRRLDLRNRPILDPDLTGTLNCERSQEKLFQID
jgi:hypothetical protein